jgi:hypothetical protein
MAHVDLFYDAHVIGPDVGNTKTPYVAVGLADPMPTPFLRTLSKRVHGWDCVQLAHDVALRLRMFGPMLRLLRDWQAHGEVVREWKSQNRYDRASQLVEAEELIKLQARRDHILVELGGA